MRIGVLGVFAERNEETKSEGKLAPPSSASASIRGRFQVSDRIAPHSVLPQ